MHPQCFLRDFQPAFQIFGPRRATNAKPWSVIVKEHIDITHQTRSIGNFLAPNICITMFFP